MSQLLDHHETLTDGVGKCSVPLFSNGCPAGFCDAPAYGFRPNCEVLRHAAMGKEVRMDGKYNGIVPGLACPRHGGPMKAEADHNNRPSTRLNPKLFLDGDSWCALHGANIQEGICGFGDTPESALESFDRDYEAWKLRQVGGAE